MKLIINGADYTEYLLSVEISSQASENRLIGNVTSKELKISLDNENKVFNNLFGYQFILTEDDGTYIGVFNVLEKPSKVTGEITVTAYDNIILTEKNYESTLDYESGSITLSRVFDEMVSRLGIGINYQYMGGDILNLIVGSCDSNLTFRQYLSMIGEISACNVYATNTGQIGFKLVYMGSSLTVTDDDIEEMTVDEDFTCTEVYYDNGFIWYSSGYDSTGSIGISPDNIFISDSSQLDYVFDKLQTLNIKIVDSLRCAEIKGAEIGDIVNYNNEFKFMVLSSKITYTNGEYNIQEISGSFDTKAQKEASSSESVDGKIRRLSIKVDQNELNFSVEIKKKVGSDEIISKINQSAEGIQIEANKINLKGAVIVDGTLTSPKGDVGGFNIANQKMSSSHTMTFDFTSADMTRVQQIIIGNITATDSDKTRYDLNGDGKITTVDYMMIRNIINLGNSIPVYFKIEPKFTQNESTGLLSIYVEGMHWTKITGTGALYSTLATLKEADINTLSVGSMNYDNDGGWIYPTLTSSFTQYDTSSATDVKYRRRDKTIEVRGVIKPTGTITGSSTNHTIFTLPTGYRPSSVVYARCQGSGCDSWLCSIDTSGNVRFGRYGDGTSFKDVTTSSWLPFTLQFFID